MRLKSVYISQYKNLRDFTLNFDGDSFIDVFVGKNGTGKSNLFEALIEIFRHLYEFDKDKSDIDFDYSVKYEIDGTETEVAWQSDKIYINGDERKTIGHTPLPDFMLIYYSGHNDTVTELIHRYEESFRKRIKNANFDESRRFIGVGSEYKALLLAMLLLQPENSKSRQFIINKLGIDYVSPEIRLELKRPFYALGDSRFNIDDRDADRYWKPEGITRIFLDRLSQCISQSTGGPVRTEGYLPGDDRYILYFNIERIQHEFNDFSPSHLFRQFDNLKTLGMLDDISIPLKLTNGIDANIAHFSDGQFQSVYIYAIVELFQHRHCITLLDEPDSFLHPEWQFEFLQQVFEITDTAAKNNHVLMSSHSASTLCSSGIDEQNINLFSIDNAKVCCSKRSKKEIINDLSNSFIQYSEDESKLLIDNVIRSSSKPILFVEGPSDVSILNTAYAKLFPGTDIPVLVQDAFDRGFIRTLLARHEIYTAYPNKHFFALFDFDDAYNNWRELVGEHIVTDIRLGLCKKLADKNAHAFLLPISDNSLKSQVWDDQNPFEKIKPKPQFCIEHIFWGNVPDDWFREDTQTGIITFKGDKHKVRFAKDVVPTLDAVHFEAFRPIFDFIHSKCPAPALVGTSGATP